MNSARRSLRALLLIAGIFGIAGCAKDRSDPPATTPAAGGGTAGKKLSIAVIPKGTSHSFWKTIHAGALEAGREENVDIIWEGPAKETEITEQINLVQQMVTRKVDGIVLAATDSQSLIKPVQDAQAKNIPVVTIDSGLKELVSYCYIATDNVEGGRRAADALAKQIGEKGKVGLLAFLKGAGSSDEREKGFLEGIKKYPNIHIVPILYYDSDAAKALDRTFALLTANPDLAGIFAASEPGGIGAANALKQKKLAGKVKLVAYDTSDDELKAFEEGTIQALIIQDPFQMGYKGVKTVLKAIRKDPVTEVYIDSGVFVVTKENFKDEKIQKLLHPALPKE